MRKQRSAGLAAAADDIAAAPELAIRRLADVPPYTNRAHQCDSAKNAAANIDTTGAGICQRQ